MHNKYNYNNLKKILKEEKVDAVFAYTIKPIIFGSLAAKQCNIHRIYSLVTGMGYNYSVNSVRVRFIRFFCNIGYRIALKKNSKVIFQNREDMQDLINKKELKQVIINTIRYIIMGIMGIVLFYIISYSLVFLKDLTVASYSGADKIGISTLLSLPTLLPEAYQSFFNYYFNEDSSS